MSSQNQNLTNLEFASADLSEFVENLIPMFLQLIIVMIFITIITSILVVIVRIGFSVTGRIHSSHEEETDLEYEELEHDLMSRFETEQHNGFEDKEETLNDKEE